MARSIQEIVEQAAQQSYQAWAAQHPSLAAVIDCTKLIEHVAASLRGTPQYDAALAGYYRSRSELEFIGKLMDLCAPLLATLLAG
jgi:hypothetical protein